MFTSTNRNVLRSSLMHFAIVIALLPLTFAEGDEADVFDAAAEVLEKHCLECHNDGNREGGLSMSSSSAFFAGGDSGEIFDREKPCSSRLIEVITPTDGKAEMPQDRNPLSSEEQQAIAKWLNANAPWPQDRKLRRANELNTDWWSFKSLSRPPIPLTNERNQRWVRNPIDSFVASSHEANQLHHAEQASRMTLIRRVYFDLLGLAPSMEEVMAFAQDDRDNAYEELVDRLLASPSYGERWARHWLDVVHFGETHGYDKDKPRMNAWPYRDYVIRAFNSDKPYSQFIREQLAGDVVSNDPIDRIEALGFIAAGPWDFIGHAEVPESKIDGKIARHLDRDDMVQNTMLTFQSLTVGCAQCHDHKFDPILQEEYYALQSVFSALDRSDKPYYRDLETQKRADELLAKRTAVQTQLASIDKKIQELGGEELANLEKAFATARQAKGKVPEAHGYHSAIEADANHDKWVQIELGEEKDITKLAWVACHDDFNSIGAGFGYPRRFKIEYSVSPDFSNPTVLLDKTAEDVANPGSIQQELAAPFRARVVRFTATKLATRANDFIFALAEMKLIDATGENVAAKGTVTALDLIEAPPRWSAKNLIDGEYPVPATEAAVVQQLEKQLDDLVKQKVPEDVVAAKKAAQEQLEQVQQEQANLPPASQAYVGMIHTGSGAFVGTGSNGGKPRPVFLLARGDVKNPLREVHPGVPSHFAGSHSNFSDDQELDDASRRVKLADWIGANENVLTWRSIANRIWHYHFGVGIVDTPNDFGHMGGMPSHPELLDWLACELRDHGDHSIKHLQKLIVTSATYRQASTSHSGFEGKDANNRLLWRMNRRRIEVEAIRDSMLVAAGQIDRQMGGPSYQDFVIEHPEHSPHYEFHLHDPRDPKTMRRSIYRMIIRSQTQPFMTTLDCADPSIQVDRRSESNSALQALAMMNDAISLCMAEKFADRLRHESQDVTDQIRQAMWLTLSREPTADEIQSLAEYVKQHGLTNTCRMLFNLNEFLFVD
jgi:mono/diheme cytochrome c family protein